jgi:hypothetical protein
LNSMIHQNGNLPIALESKTSVGKTIHHHPSLFPIPHYCRYIILLRHSPPCIHTLSLFTTPTSSFVFHIAHILSIF